MAKKQPIKFVTPSVEAIFNKGQEFAEENRNERFNTTHLFVGVQDFLHKMSSAKTYLLQTEKVSAMIRIYDAANLSSDDVAVIVKEDRYFLGNVDTGITAIDNNLIECSVKYEGQNDSFYGQFADDVLKLLDKYHIDSINYKHKFRAMNLTLSAEDFKQQIVDAEIATIINGLQHKKHESGRIQDVPDLIKSMFSDPLYKISGLFTLLGEMGTQDQSKYKFRLPISFLSNEFANEITEVCNRSLLKMYPPENTLEALDNMKELTNINRLVKKKPMLLLQNKDNIEKIEVQLCSEKYKCIALVGPAGCGKTSLVYDLAQHINAGECPDFLKDVLIYELSLVALSAGIKYMGDFEERCRRIFETVKKFKNVILFIDEGHMIASAGGVGNGDSPLGNILKPYISRGDITIITSTTDGEYKFIEKDKAISRRFQKIRIPEPSNETTKEILKGVIESKKSFYSINTINDDRIIDFIINNGHKFISGRSNPDRSLYLLDGAFAYATQKRLEKVDVSAVIKYLQLMHNIKVSPTRAKDTYSALKYALMGQDKAINRIYEDLQICELGLVNPKSPLYTFMFAGPTGVGKTEATKIIAKEFFGNENAIVTINMSQYKEKQSVANLIGAARGYVGYDNDTMLFTKVKQFPHSLVVFDEIEKAHPDVVDIFLRLLDEGELEDNRGNIISFKNTIVVFTSNLGFDHDTNQPTGAGLVKEVSGTNNVEEALKGFFRPEFIGRINDIVKFEYLTKDIIKSLTNRITDEYLKEAKENLEALNLGDYRPEYDDEDIKKITRMAGVSEEGARHLNQVVRRVLGQKLIAMKDMAS